MKKLFTLLTLLVAMVTSAWADDYYAPTGDEVIILNNVYDATATTAGYSKHTAVAWAGTASTTARKAGDPNNNGEATSDNVPCFSIKNNGKGKNISLKITGVSKVILYHEKNSGGRYPQLILTPSEGAGSTLDGEKNVYYKEFEIDGTKSYSIALQGTNGSSNQDFYVYAIKLIQHIAADKPTITSQPVGGTYVDGYAIPSLQVTATASAGDLSYQWYKCDDAIKTNAAAISGATNAAYTPSKSGFYFCRVSDSNGSEDTDVVEVTIAPAAAPSFVSVTPSATSVPRSIASTIKAEIAGNPIPTIQWYSNTENNNTTGSKIDGATDLTLSLANTSVGTFYYYAVASNSEGNVASDVITITVNDPDVHRTGFNTYYVAADDKVVGGENVFCDDITMVYDNVTYNTAVADNMISSINANYVASVGSGTNGWGVTFTPSSNGILSVGVVINGGKEFSITNASSFDYNGKQDEGDYNTSDNSGTNASDKWTPAKKQYTIITLRVTSETKYKFSVAGSKMALYGFEFVKDATATIGSTGWATFVAPTALDFTGVSDLKAYIVTGHTGTAIDVTQMTGTVPANTPLLLEGVTAAIPVAASSATDVSANKLKAGTGAAVSAEANKTKYALSAEAGVAVFKKIATSATIPAGKAYLEFNEEISAPSLSFDFGGTTGIDEVRGQMEDVRGEYYNLAGQRVAQPTKGLYIVNGKKVILK